MRRGLVRAPMMKMTAMVPVTRKVERFISDERDYTTACLSDCGAFRDYSFQVYNYMWRKLNEDQRQKDQPHTSLALDYSRNCRASF